MDNLPFVSIIMPVYNNENGLKRTLSALSMQTYPEGKWELIVIDNNSINYPEEIVKPYHFAKLLEEKSFPGSPYSARNRGLEVAKGDVIVFLDATCIPVVNWLEEGVKALHNADMVGGDVDFDINEKSSAGEIYDSLFNIQMKSSVQKRKVAKTCNLFIKRNVFESVGKFPEGLRSGGDVRWTALANKMGYSILFSPEAKVIMKPRKLSNLIKKQYRVAKGQPGIWKESNSLANNLIKKVLLCWLPPNPKELNERIISTHKPFIKNHFLSLFFIGWLLRLVNGAGNLVGLLN